MHPPQRRRRLRANPLARTPRPDPIAHVRHRLAGLVVLALATAVRFFVAALAAAASVAGIAGVAVGVAGARLAVAAVVHVLGAGGHFIEQETFFGAVGGDVGRVDVDGH